MAKLAAKIIPRNFSGNVFHGNSMQYKTGTSKMQDRPCSIYPVDVWPGPGGYFISHSFSAA